MALTWSAYADVVTPDASRAVIVRVSHDPTANRAEIWVHAFLDGRLFAHMSAHPSPALGTAITGGPLAQVRLDLPGGGLTARVRASETDRCRFDEGTIETTVSVQWDRGGAVGSNLPGREERLTAVRTQVSIGGQSWSVEGWGHQHTQTQEQPRFAVPFTYLSLRGEGIGIVGLLARRLRRGFGTLNGEPRSFDHLELTPPARTRELVARGPDGEIVGRLERRYRYWIPMGGRWRDGSIVSGVLGDRAVSGVINDYDGPAD